jgi:hypothetical protein
MSVSGKKFEITNEFNPANPSGKKFIITDYSEVDTDVTADLRNPSGKKFDIIGRYNPRFKIIGLTF